MKKAALLKIVPSPLAGKEKKQKTILELFSRSKSENYLTKRKSGEPKQPAKVTEIVLLDTDNSDNEFLDQVLLLEKPVLNNITNKTKDGIQEQLIDDEDNEDDLLKNFSSQQIKSNSKKSVGLESDLANRNIEVPGEEDILMQISENSVTTPKTVDEKHDDTMSDLDLIKALEQTTDLSVVNRTGTEDVLTCGLDEEMVCQDLDLKSL